MTRTVYTTECHTCQTTTRFDNWHEHALWTNNHHQNHQENQENQENNSILSYYHQPQPEITTYKQDWHARL